MPFYSIKDFFLQMWLPINKFLAHFDFLNEIINKSIIVLFLIFYLEYIFIFCCMIKYLSNMKALSKYLNTSYNRVRSKFIDFFYTAHFEFKAYFQKRFVRFREGWFFCIKDKVLYQIRHINHDLHLLHENPVL